VLHQVGVSFDLYYDARKHKIKTFSFCVSGSIILLNWWFTKANEKHLRKRKEEKRRKEQKKGRMNEGNKKSQ